MHQTIIKNRFTSAVRFIAAFLIITFSSTTILPPGYAQTIGLTLPIPGTMVNQSPAFVPVLLKGMTVHPDNPLQFDFIIDSGHEKLSGDELKKESERLVKYFLASMTVPQNDLWVNLSPYEKDRIIPDELGKTELGRDLLAQDYVLKQLTATMMYPEEELGKKFWDRVYRLAKEKYGLTDIPTDTFNKVWILPESASVYEHENTVYITDSHLKVMLDSDYQNATCRDARPCVSTKNIDISDLTKNIVREIILPEIEKEVNTGKNFATLRQIYHSLILAKWYKQTVKNSIMSQVYVDQNKTAGIEISDSEMKEKIYDRYMQAYQKGVFNYIKEDYDALSETVIPRQYFSGGFKDSAMAVGKTDNAVKVASAKVGDEYTLKMEARPEGVSRTDSKSDHAMLTGPYTLKGARAKIDHQDWRVRLKAAQIIARKGDRTDIPLLLDRLADSNEQVRFLAESTVKKLGVAKQQMIDGYFKAFEHINRTEKLEVARKVAELGDIDTIENIWLSKAEAGGDFHLYNDLSDLVYSFDHARGQYVYRQVSVGKEHLPEEGHWEDVGEPYIDEDNSGPGVGDYGLMYEQDQEWVVDRAAGEYEKYEWRKFPRSNIGTHDPAMLSSMLKPLAKVMSAGLFGAMIQSQAIAQGVLGAPDEAGFGSWLWETINSKLPLSIIIGTVVIYGGFFFWATETVSGNIFRLKTGFLDEKDRDGHRMFSAAKKLGRLGDKQRAVEPLIKALVHGYSPYHVVNDALKELGVTHDQMLNIYIAALKSVSPNTRRSAAHGLGVLRDKRAIESLIDALSDSDPYVIISVAEALGKLGDSGGMESLFKVLSSDFDIRESFFETIILLEQLGASHDQIFNGCLAALESKFPGIRRAAVYGLLRLGDLRAVEPLIKALSDSDTDVRIAAARVLGQFGDHRAVEPLLKVLESYSDNGSKESAAEALGKLGLNDQQKDHVAQLMRGQDERAYNYLSDLLYKLGDARGNLIYIYHSNKWEWQGSFDPYSPEGGQNVLVESAYWEGPVPRSQADHAMLSSMAKVMSAGLFGAMIQSQDVAQSVLGTVDEAGFGSWLWETIKTYPNLTASIVFFGPPIIYGGFYFWATQTIRGNIFRLKPGFFDERDYYGESVAAQRLAEFGDRRAVEPLIKVLSYSDHRVRRSAAEALGKLGDNRAVEPLIKALSDLNVKVCESADEALRKLGATHDQMLNGYIAALKSGSRDARKNAAYRLGALGDKRAIEPLMDALSDSDPRVRKTVAEVFGILGDTRAVEPLIKALSDLHVHDAHVRGSVAWALGKLGDNRAVDPLIKVLSDSDKGVRESVAFALGELGDVRASAPLLNILSSSDYDFYKIVKQALKKVLATHDQFVEGYIFALKAKSKKIKEDAAKELGWLNERRAVKPLLEALSDEHNSDVVGAVSDALKKLGLDAQQRDKVAQLMSGLIGENYNHLSNLLYKLGDHRGDFFYLYIPEETHQEEYEDCAYYGPGSGSLINVTVVDREAYWEGPVSREQSRWDHAMLAASSSREDKIFLEQIGSMSLNHLLRLRSALINGRVELSEVRDDRLIRFLKFLDENDLHDVVIMGGAVRDALLGGRVNDFDFTVKVDMGTDDLGESLSNLKATSSEVVAQSEEILERFSQALGVSKESFFDIENPVEFEGIELTYLGPKRLASGTLIRGNVFDKNTGRLSTNRTAPEILMMGLDSGGKLYAYEEALKNWMSGIARLQGDTVNGRNFWPLAILKLFRLRHQFGLAIIKSDYDLIKTTIARGFVSDERLNEMIRMEIQKIFNVAIDKELVREELEALGFKVSDVGGIDMNEIAIDRQTNTESGSETHTIQFDMKGMEPLLNMDIQGFSPVIIDMIPINSVLPLLGLAPLEKGIKYGQEEAQEELQLSKSGS